MRKRDLIRRPGISGGNTNGSSNDDGMGELLINNRMSMRPSSAAAIQGNVRLTLGDEKAPSGRFVMLHSMPCTGVNIPLGGDNE
jgi:hypothetical protein